MKKLFATELVGKTATGNDGEIIGVIDDMIVDSATGRIADVLIVPAEDLPSGAFTLDPNGRVVLPFETLRAIKDVVVMEAANE